jgi:transcription antitermination factor NusG
MLSQKKDFRWCVIYSQPNYEKKIVTELCQRKIESFLPVYLVQKKWSDRIKLLEKPLFPSYVFVKPTKEERHAVLKVAGVVKYVSFEGKVALLSDEEMDHIKKLEEIQRNWGNNSDTTYEGKCIVVLEGLFKGLRGSIVRRLNTRFYEIFFESLQRSVDIDTTQNTILVMDQLKNKQAL